MAKTSRLVDEIIFMVDSYRLA